MPVTHVQAFMHWHQGDAAVQRGEVAEGVRLYRQAVDEGAPEGIFRALALALEHLARWREASVAWVRYGTAAGRPQERDNAMIRAEGLRRTLTAARVRVVPAAAARVARVWFDRDLPRWHQAGGVSFIAEGGRHRVRVEAAGYRPWEQTVVTGYGEAQDIVVTLVPLVSVARDGG